jgi:ADP-ribose pyrophosphatase YjhB (NUDIX family)
MSNKSTDSVRIAIFNRSNLQEFLVLAEADDPDNWKLPGGKFDFVDEKADDAARRELDEELHAHVDAIGLTKAGELVNNDGVSARHIYGGKADENELKPSDEISATRWVTEETIPEGPNKGHILSAVQLARTAFKD